MIYRDQLLNACEKDKELATEVLALCSKNIFWCFNTFFWTFDTRRASPSVPFILWPYQREFLQNLEDNLKESKDLLLAKSRDMGATWIILGWLLFHWRFDKGFQALIGSRLEELIDKHGDMATHFERLRWMTKHLPSWWLPAGFDVSKHAPYMQMVNNENGCAILGQTVTEGFSRQGRYRVTWVDEFAYCDSADSAWRAMSDSAPMRIAVSSVKGLGTKFSALRRSGTVQSIEMHWSKHPEKSKGLYCEDHGNPAPSTCNWKTCSRASKTGVGKVLRSIWYDGECERRKDDLSNIASELDIDELSSGNPYFNLGELMRQVPESARWRGFFVEVDHDVEFRVDSNGPWYMWEPRDPSNMYALGADPSEGIGQDRSVAVIRDARERNLVCALVGQLRPDEFAFEISKAGRYYKNAKILCEREGAGYAVNLDLSKEYGNLWYETKVDEVTQVQSKKFGWSTNLKTRPVILAQVAEEIATSSSKMRDPRLLEECQTFIVDDSGKPRADDGFHDDFVFAWAICGFGLQGLSSQVKRASPFMRKHVPQVQRRSKTSLV